jgi:hypothetical protein
MHAASCIAALIQDLYHIEKEVRENPALDLMSARKRLGRPIFDILENMVAAELVSSSSAGAYCNAYHPRRGKAALALLSLRGHIIRER